MILPMSGSPSRKSLHVALAELVVTVQWTSSFATVVGTVRDADVPATPVIVAVRSVRRPPSDLVRTVPDAAPPPLNIVADPPPESCAGRVVS